MESMFTHRECCGSNLTLKSPLLNTTKICFLLTVPLSLFEESSASHALSRAKLTEVPPSFTCSLWGRWSLSHRGKEERTEAWSSSSDLLASGVTHTTSVSDLLASGVTHTTSISDALASGVTHTTYVHSLLSRKSQWLHCWEGQHMR